jgi:DNA primase
MSTCLQHYIDIVKASVPFNEAVRYYLHVPLIETQTKNKLYRATCPWCDKGTLQVNPMKKMMWCNDCDKGGDLITIVAESEGISPISAVVRLIDKYDIDVELCKNECRSSSRAG